MTIGETLKRARKKRNLNLDEVAKSTKIAKMFLIALENDEISKLPEGVYARNFLRTYAKFLQLDEDIMTAEYHEQYHVKPHFVLQHEQTKNDNLQFKRERKKNLLILFLLISIPAAGFWIYHRYGEEIDAILAQWTEPAPATDTSSPAAEPQQDATKNIPATDDTAVTDEPTKKQPAPVPKDPTGPAENETSAGQPADTPPREPSKNTGPAIPEIDPGTEGAPEDEAPGAMTAATEDQATEAEPVVIGTPVSLPVTSLDLVSWTGEPGQSLDEMFAFEALADVWFVVAVNGEEVTQRMLRRGQVRYYKYAEINAIYIGDITRIAIQDGTTFRERPSEFRADIYIEFGPGGLFDALDAKIARIKAKQENPP